MKEVLNTIQKKDIVSTFIRSNFQQASFNYERIHALAFCVDMIPTIKRHRVQAARVVLASRLIHWLRHF